MAVSAGGPGASGTMSSGVPGLDRILGGLVAGDNVVWVCDGPSAVVPFEDAFLREGSSAGEPCFYVTTAATPAALARRFGSDVEIVDARARRRLADPVLLEQTLLATARAGRARFVVDGLDTFARRHGNERALAFFARTCPQFFDLGSVAYWRLPSPPLGASFVEAVRRVTQCVLELRRGNLRVLKAEGHRGSAEGQLVRVRSGDGTPELSAERSLGRLASALRRVREQRQLSQADLARLAGVSPSAISQAEAGHRGLSLDTVVTLSEGLQISVDDLLSLRRDTDYVLARRDRTRSNDVITPLLDDTSAGLRAYLVSLPAGSTGTPPMAHKGAELVVVASGLVQLDLGTDTPVMRSGDAVLATRVAVRGWRNLAAEPARLFWVLRD
jgi:transcriptional regulator with XRE-family HTH domain